jgi:predicted acylesterase/phospholipase RssA
MPPARNKTALVLAGGGIMGAAYEIGCLTALDRLFAPGFNTRRFDIYVGVSAGSVIATLIANRISPNGLFHAIDNNEQSVFNFHRSDIYRLDYREVFASFWSLTTNLFRIFRNYRQNRWTFSLVDIVHILQEQFPAGLFSLGPLQKYLCQAFRREGILDDFNLLKTELYIPAYDIDRGRRIVFGSEGFRDMHICQAITASCAIPYFFRPHKVDGHYYLDGSIGRLAHLDIAIERGAKLIVVINPRVPMDNDLERFCLPSLSYGECSSIADLGITFAWEQAQRIENKEKLELALAMYRREHPDVDIVLVEPGREESLLFFQSPMSSVARNHIMNYGYHLSLIQFQDRYERLREVFARHGIRTTADHLADPPSVEASV